MYRLQQSAKMPKIISTGANLLTLPVLFLTTNLGDCQPCVTGALSSRVALFCTRGIKSPSLFIRKYFIAPVPLHHIQRQSFPGRLAWLFRPLSCRVPSRFTLATCPGIFIFLKCFIKKNKNNTSEVRFQPSFVGGSTGICCFSQGIGNNDVLTSFPGLWGRSLTKYNICSHIVGT